MFGIDDILMALPSVIQAGSGLAEIFGANKVPKEYQDYYDELLQRVKEGLPAETERRLFRTGALNAANTAAAAQNRGSAALASRGMSNTSTADAMLTGVNDMQAKMLSDLQNQIALMDEQAKQNAFASLGNVSNNIVNQRNTLSTAGWSALGGGLGNLLNTFKKPEKTFLDWLDENKDIFFSGGGLGNISLGNDTYYNNQGAPSWLNILPELGLGAIP